MSEYIITAHNLKQKLPVKATTVRYFTVGCRTAVQKKRKNTYCIDLAFQRSHGRFKLRRTVVGYGTQCGMALRVFASKCRVVVSARTTQTRTLQSVYPILRNLRQHISISRSAQ